MATDYEKVVCWPIKSWRLHVS